VPRGTGGGNEDSYYARISGHGATVVFQSYASDLVADDFNDTDDIFVWSTEATAPSNCPPGIVTQPQSRSVNAGVNVAFSVGVNACGANFFQWFFNGMALSGQTNSALALLNVRSCDAGSYHVVLSNSLGAATSSVATLTVTNAPALLSPGGSFVTTTQTECASLTLVGGATYRWELKNATGTQGVHWDLVSVPFGVDVRATPSNHFTIQLASLNGAAAGPALNFDFNSNYLWTIATAAQGFTNFNSNAFTVNNAPFSNDLAGGVFSVEEGSLRVRFTRNQAPSANNMNVTRAPNSALQIRISDLLTNAFDPDGDATALFSVNALSTNAVSVTSDGTNIYYAATTNNVHDRVVYAVRDVRAAYRAGDTVRTASAFIDISVGAPPAATNVAGIVYSGGVPMLTFTGLPGYTYDVQRTTNLATSIVWTTLWTTNAPTNGVFHFSDPSPPVDSAFYRSAQR